MMDYIWSIAIYTGTTPLTIEAPGDVKNPVLTGADVTDVSAKYTADPFMVYHETHWYMFFEVLNSETERGEIGMASSRDGFAWQYGRIVLRESFHLSYPYVFRFEGDFYMMPEARQAQSVRLYRAINFPVEWQHVQTLLEGDLADPSVFFHDGKWWMFVLEGEDILRLYFAVDLRGPWREHVKSPVVTANLKISRPGGRVLATGGRIIRFAQDGVPLYGSRLRALEIRRLDETSYEEAELSESPILKANRRGWNAIGMHHIDIHLLADGRWLACVDGATIKIPLPSQLHDRKK
jgi:hypothetical protein